MPRINRVLVFLSAAFSCVVYGQESLPSTPDSVFVEWLRTPLTAPIADSITANPYDEEKNVGHVILKPTGEVISEDIGLFDENDKLWVSIVAHKDLLPVIKVQRTSEVRNKSMVRIVGDKDTKCRMDSIFAMRNFYLQDFEPGAGKIEIVLIGIPDKVVGSFEFNVNPLYSGVFSYGGVCTWADDPQYKLVNRSGDESEIMLIEDNANDRDMLYAAFYTPYIWGKRDIQKGTPFKRAWECINPTIGLVPTNINHHCLVGGSIELSRLPYLSGLPGICIFTAGLHIRRVEALADDANVKSGEPFVTDGETAIANIKLPSSHEWTKELFLALSIDFRVAGSFLSKAIKSVTGK